MDAYRRYVFTLVIMTVFVFSVHAGMCGAEPTPRTKTLTMMFWGSAVDKPVMDFFFNGCRAFEKSHPGIRVQVDFCLVEHYKTKLPLLMAMNNPPDIFMTWSGAFLETYIRAGKVLPLDDDLDAAPGWRDSFEKTAFDSVRFNNKIYAIPTAKAVAALFYNKEIFNRLGLKPPKTYDELKHTIKTLRASGVLPMALGNKDPWVGGMLAGQIIQRLDHRPLLAEVKSGKRSWDDPSFIKAGGIIQELNRLEAFPKGFNAIDYQGTIELFAQGRAAMMLMGSWFFQNLFTTSPLPEGSIGVIPFPVFKQSPGSPDAWMGQTDMNLAISSRCREKDAAIQFLTFITSLPSQEKLFKHTGVLPVTRISMDNGQFRPEIVSLMQQLRTMKSMSLFPDIHLGGVEGQEFNEAIKAILEGRDPATVFKHMSATLTHGQEPR